MLASVNPCLMPFRTLKQKVKPVLFLLLTVPIVFCACQQKTAVADPVFVDSIIAHYDSSLTEKAIAGDLQFWQKKLENDPGSLSTMATVAGDHLQ